MQFQKVLAQKYSIFVSTLLTVLTRRLNGPMREKYAFVLPILKGDISICERKIMSRKKHLMQGIVA